MIAIGFIFPGQGSQYVGMGKDLHARYASARKVYEEANDALGWDITRLCFEGPEETLKLTAHTQPAILTVSVAALRLLEDELPVAPIAAAGHSLGEYAALVAAGGLRFRDAVRLVHLRGKFMQEAVPVGQGAMAALLGMTPEEVEALCREEARGEILSAANFNAPGQIVIAGHSGAVDRAVRRVTSLAGKKAVLLPVSAPFHCLLMKEAAERLANELNKVEVEELRFPVLSNARADFYPGKDQIRPLLVEQVVQPVRWEACMQKMIGEGVSSVLEIGPGKVLSGLMRRINRDIKTANLEDGAGWEKIQSLIHSAG